MQKNLGLSDSQIVVKDEIYDDQAQLINNALQELIDEDCDIIFATILAIWTSSKSLQTSPNIRILSSHIARV
jgi:hypothetical protein